MFSQFNPAEWFENVKKEVAVITVRVSINKPLMGKVIYLILFPMSAM